MTHMNIFHNFYDLDIKHEDMLTRSFLILINSIPLYRMRFFELINDTMAGDESYKPVHSNDLIDIEVKTQVDKEDKLLKQLSDFNVLSILISNEHYNTKDEVRKDEYNHRYDGVIKTINNVFVIEDKPNVDNVWREQLNLNIDSKNNVIVKTLCSLKWSDIINFSNDLLQSNILSPLENLLINDFLDYVDANYSWLNAYNRFSLCKDNDYLLNKRCINIMSQLYEKAEVLHHNGWLDYVKSNNEIVPEVALHVNQDNEDEYVELIMVAGDAMRRAEKMFNKIEFSQISKLIEENFDIYSSFHFSFSNTNLMWSTGNLSIEEYIKYWKTKVNNGELQQISRRNNENQFLEMYDQLLKDGIVSENNKEEFINKIVNKGYQTINICPNLCFAYYWSKKDAITLDDDDKFVDDFKKKVNLVIELFK